MAGKPTTLAAGTSSEFFFDNVLPQTATQAEVFQTVAAPFVEVLYTTTPPRRGLSCQRDLPSPPIGPPVLKHTTTTIAND